MKTLQRLLVPIRDSFPYTRYQFQLGVRYFRPICISQRYHGWAVVPDETDILVTHGPSKGVLDVTYDWGMKAPIHVGSKSLAEHVEKRIKPRIHAFGHVHDEEGIQNFGTLTRGETHFIICSVVDSKLKFANNGVLIEIEIP